MSLHRDEVWKSIVELAAHPELRSDGPIKFLRVIGEYRSDGLFADFGIDLRPEGSPIPSEIWQELRQIVRAYEPILLMRTEEEINKHKERWDEIDTKGVELAKRISALLNGLEVRYWSEGRGMYIWPEESKVWYEKEEH